MPTELPDTSQVVQLREPVRALEPAALFQAQGRFPVSFVVLWGRFRTLTVAVAHVTPSLNPVHDNTGRRAALF